jgi:hypothetical protein
MDSQDSSLEISISIGIAIRLAMRMGMHRHSRAHDGVTPFQREMRCRVWANIRAMDIISSFQLSLPTAIHSGDSLSILPRNIFDHEFQKEINELPLPRTLSEEETEISCTIIKTRLALELGKIVAFVESEDDPSLEDICIYEQSLEEVKGMVPMHLSVSSTQKLAVAPLGLYLRRINIDRLYQASKCVLHRNSLSQARHDSHKLKQRGKCIDAAMTLLAHQTTLYVNLKTYPQNMRKRHMHTLSTHDFYTASMAVALDLHYGFESEPFMPSPSDVSLWGYDRRNEMITALEMATEFCKLSKNDSLEAANAWGMLSFVIAKARKAQWMIAEQQVINNSTAIKWSPQSGNVHELSTEIFNDPLPDFDWVRDIISNCSTADQMTLCRIFGISSITVMTIVNLRNNELCNVRFFPICRYAPVKSP